LATFVSNFRYAEAQPEQQNNNNNNNDGDYDYDDGVVVRILTLVVRYKLR